MTKRIVVGMSGGVDSSVAAYLLKEAGYDVIGLFMRNWTELDGTCTAQDDYEDAKSVSLKLDIPFYAVDFSKEYYDGVFSHFLDEYKKGRTPNPDILCNSKIKFRVFADYCLKEFDADAIATGHYARVRNSISIDDSLNLGDFDSDKEVHLFKADDLNKDQSYFLSALSASQLSRAVFPLSAIEKPEVRRIAEKLSLRTAKKKDSTGICFIGERNFRQFLSQYLTSTEGDMVDEDTGKVISKHKGLMYYTIGQRRGLGIGGCGTGERWFVTRKDTVNNVLYVCQGDDNPLNNFSGLIARDITLVNNVDLNRIDDIKVKYRYRQADIDCKVTMDTDSVKVIFDEPQKGVAAGQSCVFYSKNECLGQAVIDETLK